LRLVQSLADIVGGEYLMDSISIIDNGLVGIAESYFGTLRNILIVGDYLVLEVLIE
jgi:hypothetical protein